MTDRFNTFMAFIYKWENVYDKNGNVIAENDPDDSGGCTKYGIDKASHPGVDVRNLTEPQARQIYWEEWIRDGCESYGAGLGEVYFNACVNCGIGRAKKLLAKSTDATGFIDAQNAFYRALAAQNSRLSKFLKGWLNRTADLRKFLNL